MWWVTVTRLAVSEDAWSEGSRAGPDNYGRV